MKVPFNDLSRVHRYLLKDFEFELEDAVSTNSFILGEQVTKFETSYAQLEGAKFCVTVNSGTSAIELALRSLGIKRGDEVIIPSFTFVATAFGVLQAGGTPKLCDVNKDTTLMDLDSLEHQISHKTKALILVTLHGAVENLDIYKQICEKRNIKLVIDGAQSHMSRFKGSPLTDYANCVTTSFYPGKNLGALGDGGAVLTNSESLTDKIKLYRNWGAVERYNHQEWGGNYRFDALQARFLLRKMAYLEEWTDNRKFLANRYRESINPEVLRPKPSSQGDHVYHVFDILVKNREKIRDDLSKVGVETGVHYPRAVHQNSYYTELDSGQLRNSEIQAEKTLSLPLFPGMSDEEQGYVIEHISRMC